MVPSQVRELGEEQDLVQLGGTARAVLLEPGRDMEHHLGELLLVVGNIHEPDSR